MRTQRPVVRARRLTRRRREAKIALVLVKVPVLLRQTSSVPKVTRARRTPVRVSKKLIFTVVSCNTHLFYGPKLKVRGYFELKKN
jgi:hypothetical protein